MELYGNQNVDKRENAENRRKHENYYTTIHQEDRRLVFNGLLLMIPVVFLAQIFNWIVACAKGKHLMSLKLLINMHHTIAYMELYGNQNVETLEIVESHYKHENYYIIIHQVARRC